MPTISGMILDSSGRPASGFLGVRANSAFEIDGGLVTQSLAQARVRDGVPYGPTGEPWTLPPTPLGVKLTLIQDLDGELAQVFTVTIPDEQQLTYSQLLYHRGGAEGGPQPYLWDLTGGIDFPDGAVAGDYGWDRDTDDIWEYQP